MHAFRFVAALSLAAGLTFSAGSAKAQGNDRLDDLYELSDTKCNDSNEPNTRNGVEIDIGGESSDDFEVYGRVNGVGTDGDLVEISYLTDGLNKVSADSKKGTISQKEWSQLCVFIDQLGVTGGRDEATCVNPEKCKHEGTVKVDSNTSECTGNASASCSGTDLYEFLSSDQVTSIQAAFPKGNDCGVKFDPKDPGKKSTLKINLKAKKDSGDCIAQDDE